MHEASLMGNLLTIAEESLSGYNVTKINCLNIKAGKLANILPDALIFAFQSLAEAPFAGARLEIEVLPITARCLDCGAEYQSMDIPLVCPDCGSNMAAIISGSEVYLDSIDFDQEE